MYPLLRRIGGAPDAAAACEARTGALADCGAPFKIFVQPLPAAGAGRPCAEPAASAGATNRLAEVKPRVLPETELFKLLHRGSEPCLPRGAAAPPAEPGWPHEIKHDGFRIMARRDSCGLRLFTRNGYNFAGRFPAIVAAIASLPVRSCLIDGEAIMVDETGLSVFELLRYRRHDHAALLCAFDLVELEATTCDADPSRSAKISWRSF